MSTIVFTFGRMNPPTKGHERLITKVVETAKIVGGDHIVYLSHTQNNSTDPLDWKFKRRVCESAFPGVKISKDESVKTPFQALEKFRGVFEKAILIVGEDQVGEFTERMTPYAKKWGIDFETVSAGERISESTDIDGISATKLRQFAVEGNRKEFFNGLPSRLTNNTKRLVYEKTVKSLNKSKK